MRLPDLPTKGVKTMMSHLTKFGGLLIREGRKFEACIHQKRVSDSIGNDSPLAYAGHGLITHRFLGDRVMWSQADVGNYCLSSIHVEQFSGNYFTPYESVLYTFFQVMFCKQSMAEERWNFCTFSNCVRTF